MLILELVALLIILGIARKLFDACDTIDRADDQLEQR